jgi:hypothetical protein
MRCLLCLFLAAAALADRPKDNLASAVRPIPPPGVPVPEADRKVIQQALSELRVAIDNATKAPVSYTHLTLPTKLL